MQQKISVGLSLYLEAVRFLASVCVLLYHTLPIVFPGGNTKLPGHEAVVVFFVLSGYVISHAANRPDVTLSTYIAHRLARIVPVAYCALFFALVISLVVVPSSELKRTWIATAANALFIAQSGTAFLDAPLNAPFWSLNYEVWYYIIFGCWVFSSKRWRFPITAVALLAAGPKILLLFPVWLYGVVLYRAMPKFDTRSAAFVFVATLVLGALLTWLDVSSYIRSWLYSVFPPAWHAHYSTQFIYDLLLGAIVFLNFSAVASLDVQRVSLTVIERPVRYLAGFTFSVYVFHSILAVAITKLLEVHSAWLFYALMAAGIFVLAQFTERRTELFRSGFTAICDRVVPQRLSRSPEAGVIR
jgi:peptidoglycan/LPS O-acetylase OafA/YrhL